MKIEQKLEELYFEAIRDITFKEEGSKVWVYGHDILGDVWYLASSSWNVKYIRVTREPILKLNFKNSYHSRIGATVIEMREILIRTPKIPNPLEQDYVSALDRDFKFEEDVDFFNFIFYDPIALKGEVTKHD